MKGLWGAVWRNGFAYPFGPAAGAERGLAARVPVEDLVPAVAVAQREAPSAHGTPYAELKRRLGMDSTNSSKPPSSDPLEKKSPRSQRVRSKDRRPGGQPGRAGRCLEPVAVPDRVERVEPPNAPTVPARCPVRWRRASALSRSSTSR
ncbi:DUF6444 domain-containing protein [Streptomyces sp. NBC_01619]|uniref:DUF6444 domain-containing protein n=1 Tax=Streptomyces sp. NBC_01619 TaxID=2975901 RepID=UPI00338DEE59